MKTELPKRFLLVDDDPINNLIIAHQLKTAISNEIEIVSFTLPEEGIDFVSNYESYDQEIPTVLFLDLNMPVISGWDFLEKIKTLDEKITNQLTIFILSSSVDNRDLVRAKEISLVKDYLMKPLTQETLINLF